MSRYLIIGLPRSRTAWLSVAMTDGPSFCYHEPLMGCDSVNELKEKFDKTDNKFVGGADTSAVLFLDTIIQTLPDIKILLIDRPVEESKRSCEEMGLPATDMSMLVEAVNKAKENPNVKVIDYSKLQLVETGEEIWKYLIGSHPFNKHRWSELMKLDIQIYIPHFVRKVHKEMASLKTLMENQ